MSNNKQALKAGVWYTISNFAIKAISVVTAPIFTRLLSPEDYGQFNNFFSWQTILACVFGLCLNYSIGRAKLDFKNDFDGFISSIQSLSIIVGLLFFALTLPFIDKLASFMELDKGLLISLMVMLIVSPSIDYVQSKFRFEYRYKENVIIALVNSIGVVLLAVGFIMISDLQHRYVGRIMGSVVPAFGIGLFAVIYIQNKGKRCFVVDYWKYALRISLPMIPHGLAMVLLAQIDRIMLIKMDGFEAAGLYSFGYSYALLITLFTNAIMNAWQPWLYERVTEGKHYDIYQSNRKINLLVFFFVLILISLAPEAIIILGSKPFHAARWMIAPVIAGCFFQFFYGYFSIMELYCKKTELVAYGSVLAAITKILLNLYFIPKFGYVGAAYTTMLSYFLLLVYHWFMFRRIFKALIFAEKQMFVLAILLIAFVLTIVQFYDLALLRYVIIMLLVLTLLLRYRRLALVLLNNFHK